MNSAAARVIAAATRRLGVHEVPWGSNRGELIDTWSARWGMRAVPWCNIFTDAMYREAGVSDGGIQSPATAITAENARRAGMVTTHPTPGALICWPGRHIGIIEHVHTPTVVGTIEGNTSDMVARRTRSTTGAIIITPPAVRGDTTPPATTTIYCYEDPAGPVLIPGRWRLKASAQRARDKHPGAGHRARLTRTKRWWRVRLPKEFRFTTRAQRDTAMAAREAQTGRRMRPTRRTATTTPTASGLGKTT